MWKQNLGSLGSFLGTFLPLEERKSFIHGPYGAKILICKRIVFINNKQFMDVTVISDGNVAVLLSSSEHPQHCVSSKDKIVISLDSS